MYIINFLAEFKLEIGLRVAATRREMQYHKLFRRSLFIDASEAVLVCGSPRLCRRRERRLIGVRFGRWREERFGRARCLTLRYSLLLSVWVDPSAEHGIRPNPLVILILLRMIMITIISTRRP